MTVPRRVTRREFAINDRLHVRGPSLPDSALSASAPGDFRPVFHFFDVGAIARGEPGVTHRSTRDRPGSTSASPKVSLRARPYRITASASRVVTHSSLSRADRAMHRSIDRPVARRRRLAGRGVLCPSAPVVELSRRPSSSSSSSRIDRRDRPRSDRARGESTVPYARTPRIKSVKTRVRVKTTTTRRARGDDARRAGVSPASRVRARVLSPKLRRDRSASAAANDTHRSTRSPFDMKYVAAYLLVRARTRTTRGAGATREGSIGRRVGRGDGRSSARDARASRGMARVYIVLRSGASNGASARARARGVRLEGRGAGALGLLDLGD